MMRSKYAPSICLCIGLFGLTVGLFGCGGSSGDNPMRETEETGEFAPPIDSQMQPLSVNVDVSGTTVHPGDTVEITATVGPVRGTDLLFSWVNVTGYGTMPETNGNRVVWTAPASLDTAQVKVEVIQLVVTAISQVVSVKESGVETDTEVMTKTETVLITVTN